MATSTQWQLARDAAQRYQDVLVPAILGTAAVALVERVAPVEGEAVLDVGCGSGAAAFAARARVGRTGRVVGADLNPGMLEVARSLDAAEAEGLAPIEWREESVLDLSFDEASFDVVTCAQCLQFVVETERALRELRRVTRPGGRTAISLWCRAEESPYFDALVSAVATHLSPEVAAGLASAFAFSDVERLRASLTTAGFDSIETEVATLELPLPPPRVFVGRHVRATPMGPGFDAADEAVRAAIVAEVGERLAMFADQSSMCVPFRTWITVARRAK